MRVSCSSKTYYNPSRIRTRLCAVASRTHNSRRRTLTSHSANLSTCPEETPGRGYDLTSPRGGNQSVDFLAPRAYSSVVGSSSDTSAASHLMFRRSCARRPAMPPGPPTSPVPSPPLFVAPTQPCPLTLDLPRDTLTSNLLTSTSLSAPQKSRIPYVLRNCLRRRRNAVCGNNSLGQELKDFFASYVMSHLSDSMSYSLNLNSTVTPLSSAQRVVQPASDPDGPPPAVFSNLNASMK